MPPHGRKAPQADTAPAPRRTEYRRAVMRGDSRYNQHGYSADRQKRPVHAKPARPNRSRQTQTAILPLPRALTGSSRRHAACTCFLPDDGSKDAAPPQRRTQLGYSPRHEHTTVISGGANDAGQHARQRRAVARRAVLAVPPPGDPEHRPLARSRAGTDIRPAHGMQTSCTVVAIIGAAAPKANPK
jgi:hypothetical protein